MHALAFTRSSPTFWCRLSGTFPLRVRLSRSYARDCSNSLPFPSQRNPQPHDIFHLPKSATQKEIKQRYYDLVRIYHPDSIIARRDPPEVSQERIQAINKAYDILRGKNVNVSLDEPDTTAMEHMMDPAWLRGRLSRRPYFDDVSVDDRWKERFIMVFAAFALVGFVVQTSYYRLQVIKASPTWPARQHAKKHPQCNDEILAESDSLDDRSCP
ncbi:hypothetical protein F5J12DRAFT_712715 [Pisolithus orientalis]|uniref:uncharacterized protein n=1 Tax=Pisolithus orientalis TaxID=936130 RepID=UPI002224A321|nr:uncharacterized protein F5J12DRAFT_712715 [Pisolithus orientalis]KAI6033185.1 hypothetical protein F5J12DRAFT_712715 [Pisolithus orientalis]